ncbi:hypothetical protein [Caenimonas sp. SL110]|uniref:hypothetical protein n=1 Tax=Caenimonas sp. SL110 TaxID=1450524 RepID=UPI00065297B8|nr:hypothetical protein [Caenimonas sp. SL110]
MRNALAVILTATLTLACSKPQDIVFGPEPLRQISEQGDQFKKLPEEDRTLLVAYLGVTQIGKAFGAETKSPTGRTVGEVLADARAWKERVQAAEAEAKKREAEAEALKAKVLAERKAIMERISSSVVVAIIGTRVLPKNYDAGRYSEMLSISYAIENKSEKAFLQLKGRAVFKDATGDLVGWLPVDFDEPVGAGKTLKTTTGRGWKLNEFRNGEIEKIAGREFSSMKATFEPESIAFEGGEVLKAPEVRE